MYGTAPSILKLIQGSNNDLSQVRQVIFTDVVIVGRLDGDCQNFASIGLHKTDAGSDWLLIKWQTALVWKACRSPITKLIG